MAWWRVSESARCWSPGHDGRAIWRESTATVARVQPLPLAAKSRCAHRHCAFPASRADKAPVPSQKSSLSTSCIHLVVWLQAGGFAGPLHYWGCSGAVVAGEKGTANRFRPACAIPARRVPDAMPNCMQLPRNGCRQGCRDRSPIPHGFPIAQEMS